MSGATGSAGSRVAAGALLLSASAQADCGQPFKVGSCDISIAQPHPQFAAELCAAKYEGGCAMSMQTAREREIREIAIAANCGEASDEQIARLDQLIRSNRQL